MKALVTLPAIALLPLLLAQCAPAPVAPQPAASPFKAIEQASGGRLGAALVDSTGTVLMANRADERFALCSTFKLLLAAMVLDGAARGQWALDDALPLTGADIISHSPVMKPLVPNGSVTMAQAAEATVTTSDNAAANLLLRRMGGNPALNAWLRGLGDDMTRLDRLEPALNENAAGDPRDTTTPAAMARITAKLVLGDALRPSDRDRLRGWMVEASTGLARIRAGTPPEWTVGDKTGTCGGEGPSYNDVAFILPDGGKGHVLAVYLDRPLAEDPNAHIADVARVVTKTIAAR